MIAVLPILDFSIASKSILEMGSPHHNFFIVLEGDELVIFQGII